MKAEVKELVNGLGPGPSKSPSRSPRPGEEQATKSVWLPRCSRAADTRHSARCVTVLCPSPAVQHSTLGHVAVSPSVVLPPPCSPPAGSTCMAPSGPRCQATTQAYSPRSFVPPVRDEEHEIQRKAHAKRVRETRRSTQGVTLEDLKSAEQLVKKKQQQVGEVQGEVIG